MPVTLHVWRVPRRAIGAAMLRMAFPPRQRPDVRFRRYLGTASGFGPTDADLSRYAAVTVSDQPVSYPRWDAIATTAARVDLRPLSSRGRWAGREPFSPEPGGSDGMVLALTRARLRPSRIPVFWRAVPPVVRELADAPGLLGSFGVGEAPIGWQGTVSVWRGSSDLTRFAYRQPEHRAVIARTPTDRWYAEELFARFAVLGITGDREVLGWRTEGGTPDEARGLAAG